MLFCRSGLDLSDASCVPIITSCMSLAQDTVTGFLLAGVGNMDLRRKGNFLVVNESALP